MPVVHDLDSWIRRNRQPDGNEPAPDFYPKPLGIEHPPVGPGFILTLGGHVLQRFSNNGFERAQKTLAVVRQAFDLANVEYMTLPPCDPHAPGIRGRPSRGIQ